MKIILPLLTFGLLSSRLFSQVEYTTDCVIENGKATGFVNNLKDAFDVNGHVWFQFYDANGNFISSDKEFEYEYVSAGKREEIEFTHAPENAQSCIFDVTEAAGGIRPLNPVQSGNPEKTYDTRCDVFNGRAKGYVNNFRDAKTVSGKIYFYFYDCKGEFVSKVEDQEFEYVSARESEEIESVTAPRNACSCYLDVSEAIR